MWRYYRIPGDRTNIPRRPSYAILTACHQAQLYRIVHETINMFCGAHGKITARDLLERYRRYLTWKDNLPAQIAHVDMNAQALPHILFLQYAATKTAYWDRVGTNLVPVYSTTPLLSCCSCPCCMSKAFPAARVTSSNGYSSPAPRLVSRPLKNHPDCILAAFSCP